MDPDYEWVDQGPVIESKPGTADSVAVDPGIVLDASGRPWLTWGASASGIRLRRLDPGTGLPSRRDKTIHTLARYGIFGVHLQAPVIIERNGSYDLFVTLGRGGITVGRSSDATGPYTARFGKSM